MKTEQEIAQGLDNTEHHYNRRDEHDRINEYLDGARMALEWVLDRETDQGAFFKAIPQ